MGKNKKPSRLLTEVELELMNVVWKLGRCSVREVLDLLPKERDLAYTSVATVMKILEEKGVLKSEKKEKSHTYRALVAREDYETKALQHVTEKVFAGNPSSLVMRLLDEAKLSREELQEIRRTLEEKLK